MEYALMNTDYGRYEIVKRHSGFVLMHNGNRTNYYADSVDKLRKTVDRIIASRKQVEEEEAKKEEVKGEDVLQSEENA